VLGSQPPNWNSWWCTQKWYLPQSDFNMPLICQCYHFSGVGLTLNGMTLANNSILDMADIGTGNAALACTITYGHCCSSGNHETQWYIPNGSQVPNNLNLPYQRTRGHFPGRVILNRNSRVPQQKGDTHCC